MVRTFILLLALSITANAQTILVRSNEVAGLIQPDHTLTAQAGSIRLNVTAMNAGTPLDVSDVPSFELTLSSRIDGYRLGTYTNTLTPAIDPSQGQMRWIVPSLGAGSYEWKGVAKTYDTNAEYVVHWGYLEVTNPPPAGGATVNIGQTNQIEVTNSISVTVNQTNEVVTTVTNFHPVTLSPSITITNEIQVGNTTVSNTLYNSISNFVDATVTIPGLTVDVDRIYIPWNQLLTLGFDKGKVLGADGLGGVELLDVRSNAFSVAMYDDLFSLLGVVTGIAWRGDFEVRYTNGLAEVWTWNKSGFPPFWEPDKVTMIEPTAAWDGTGQYGTPEPIYVTTQPTTTQVLIRLRGGASAAYSSGGFTELQLAHPTALKSRTFEFLIGQGGLITTSQTGVGYTIGESAFPNGGRGISTNGAASWQRVNLGGAGRTQVAFADTSEILGIAGGGAGGYSGTAGFSGGAGGNVGFGRTTQDDWQFADGGSQTTGGAYAGKTTWAGTWLIEPTDGGYLQGGDGGVISNATANATPSGYGGGDGYMGGGGGAILTGTSRGFAGTGSGFVNTTNPIVVAGRTERAQYGNTAPAADDPYWVNDYGLGGPQAIGSSLLAPAQAGTRGNHGSGVMLER